MPDEVNAAYLEDRRREAMEVFDEMLIAVHALGAYKVEAILPITEKVVALNGNYGIHSNAPSPVIGFLSVKQEAESRIRKAQAMFVNGRQLCPVTITWCKGNQPITY